MTIKLVIGPNAITSYRRLAYTPWHALAEFVDNSTQSYINNQTALDQQMQTEDEKVLSVSIAYDGNNDYLRVVDNAMGMSLQELDDALHVGNPFPFGRLSTVIEQDAAAILRGKHRWCVNLHKAMD